MKRVLLWLSNLLFLMFLSAAAAVPAAPQLQALDATEVDAITAGTCSTCKPDYPYIEYEGWDLISRRESAHTYMTRRSVEEYVNPSSHVPANYAFEYSNDCQRIITGGSITLGRSLGISFNTIYHCPKPMTLSFTVPPLGRVKLYEGRKRYYVTSTYRHYMQWSDGYREFSGLTDTIREEYSYYYREIE